MRCSIYYIPSALCQKPLILKFGLSGFFKSLRKVWRGKKDLLKYSKIPNRDILETSLFLPKATKIIHDFGLSNLQRNILKLASLHT